MELHQLPPVAGPQATILACGAWLKNTACLLQGDTVLWSAAHGDLGEPDACIALERSVAALVAHATLPIDAVAHDLHPDFFSSQLACQVAAQLEVPAIAVQHHHAHVGVLMAEYGLDEPVLGLALDGVGLGTDGVSWGGELLFVEGAHWERCGHLRALPLAGGDTAAREPWRIAAAVLHALDRADEIEARFGDAVGATAARTVRAMLDKSLNCAPTTSAGRWFDAAAGALGINLKQHYEAEAAIALEQSAAGYLAKHPAPAPLGDDLLAADGTLDLLPLLARLFALADAGEAGHGAALFHVTLADALARWATRAAAARGVTSVALGGGCFFNRILTLRLRAQLAAAGLTVLLPQAVSCGDAGLALGQAWVARQLLAQEEMKQERTCV